MKKIFFLKYILNLKIIIRINSFFILLFFFLLKTKKRKKNSALVLSPERFRGEIELLKRNSNIQLLLFPEKILNYLLIPFEDELDRSNRYYFKKSKKSKILRKKIQIYFQEVLKILFKFYDIKLMVGASCFYKRDNDFSLAGKKLGAKYIVFLRENMAPFEISNFIKYFEGRVVTKPDLIFTQCISTSLAYKKMKIFSGVKVINFGSLRMSKFIKKIFKLRKEKIVIKNKTKKNKNIIFFSFTYNSLLEFYKNPSISSFSKEGLVYLFKNSHNHIIDYARKNQEIKLTIKTKWGKNWHDLIIKNWKKFSNDEPLPKNVTLTMNGNVHQMILKADLVISFFSTAMCEAGLRNIPIIFLYFNEIKNKFKKFIDINWIKKSYFICNDYRKIENDINFNLSNFKISKKIRKNRDNSFEEYASILKITNHNELVKEINKVIA